MRTGRDEGITQGIRLYVVENESLIRLMARLRLRAYHRVEVSWFSAHFHLAAEIHYDTP
jgi:hypothetical protein